MRATRMTGTSPAQFQSFRSTSRERCLRERVHLSGAMHHHSTSQAMSRTSPETATTPCQARCLSTAPPMNVSPAQGKPSIWNAQRCAMVAHKRVVNLRIAWQATPRKFLPGSEAAIFGILCGGKGGGSVLGECVLLQPPESGEAASLKDRHFLPHNPWQESVGSGSHGCGVSSSKQSCLHLGSTSPTDAQ